MSVHEQFAEDLSLYALGALEGKERLAVEQHLEACTDCRRELEQLRGDAALLAFSASGPRPPARSRERLMAALAKEPRRNQQTRPAAWWRGLGWAVAAAAVVLVFLLIRQNGELKRIIASLQAGSTQQEQQLKEARDLIASLTSPEAERFTLVASKTPPQPQGKTIYIRTSGTVVFLASNMPQLPPEKTYELWLIPASGAPIPAGIFKPDSHGNATIIKPPLPSGVDAKTFAITVEPEGGSTAPTMPIIMMGSQG